MRAAVDGHYFCSSNESRGMVPKSTSDLGGFLPEWFRLTDPGVEEGQIDELVLRIIRRLESVYPERVDLSDCDNIRVRVDEFNRVWSWFEREEIVSGPLENCSLTLAGCQAYRSASKSAPDAIKAALNSSDGVKGDDARTFMINTLREFFHSYVDRTRDR